MLDCILWDTLNFFLIIFYIVSLKILINGQGTRELEDLPSAGHSYTLMCSLLGANVYMSYQWRKNGGVLNEIGPTLSFLPLRLSDAGEYSCEAIGTVQHSITLMSMQFLIVVYK